MLKYIWVRVGDTDDYHQFEDLKSLIEELSEINIGTVIGWQESGFQTHSYNGHNYISCFWGDDDAQHLNELSFQEQVEIEKALLEHEKAKP